MDQPGLGEPPKPQDSAVSRLPWRYSPPGRSRLVAAARRLSGGSGGRGSGAARPGGDYDIRLAVREESAANLGRAGARLKAAVAALAEFDAIDGGRGGDGRSRHGLVEEAALVLWEYVVQREAAGLTRHELVDQIYGVTPELWRRMGSVDPLPGPRRAVASVPVRRLEADRS
jgi:hypothetical protein